jgi:hypothetical protein
LANHNHSYKKVTIHCVCLLILEEKIVLNVSQSEAGIAHDDHVFVQSE